MAASDEDVGRGLMVDDGEITAQICKLSQEIGAAAFDREQRENDDLNEFDFGQRRINRFLQLLHEEAQERVAAWEAASGCRLEWNINPGGPPGSLYVARFRFGRVEER